MNKASLLSAFPNEFIVAALGLLAFAGCIESYVPETERSSNLLVVEGHISDKPVPYTVVLSRSRALTSSLSSPEAGASVFVKDQTGAEFRFEEVAPGIYRTDPSHFVGIAGEIYTLSIETKAGDRYASSPVTLKSTPPIDSVYYEREQRLTDDGQTQDGIRVLVDSHDSTGQTRYYRFEWDAAYAIEVPYPSQWDYTPERQAFVVEHFQTCYTTDSSSAILVHNTLHLKDDQVSQFELNYVNTDSYRLRTMYSVLVRQYALSESGFLYWNELSKTTENLGTLFDPQAYQVKGNIKSVEAPDEDVLGYFDASTVSEKRIFVSREELVGLDFPANPCTNRLETMRNVNEVLPYLSWGYRIVTVEQSFPRVVAPPECADCRKLGTPQKPSFWPQ